MFAVCPSSGSLLDQRARQPAVRPRGDREAGLPGGRHPPADHHLDHERDPPLRSVHRQTCKWQRELNILNYTVCLCVCVLTGVFH